MPICRSVKAHGKSKSFFCEKVLDVYARTRFSGLNYFVFFEEVRAWLQAPLSRRHIKTAFWHPRSGRFLRNALFFFRLIDFRGFWEKNRFSLSRPHIELKNRRFSAPIGHFLFIFGTPQNRPFSKILRKPPGNQIWRVKNKWKKG